MAIIEYTYIHTFLRRYFLKMKTGSRQEAVLLWAGALEPTVLGLALWRLNTAAFMPLATELSDARLR